MTTDELIKIVAAVKDVLLPFHYQLIKRIEELEEKIKEFEKSRAALGEKAND